MQRLAEEASILWKLAADQCRWGFVAEAADTRRLAVSRRVQAILAISLSAAEAAPETDF